MAIGFNVFRATVPAFHSCTRFFARSQPLPALMFCLGTLNAVFRLYRAFMNSDQFVPAAERIKGSANELLWTIRDETDSITLDNQCPSAPDPRADQRTRLRCSRGTPYPCLLDCLFRDRGTSVDTLRAGGNSLSRSLSPNRKPLCVYETMVLSRRAASSSAILRFMSRLMG